VLQTLCPGLLLGTTESADDDDHHDGGVYKNHACPDPRVFDFYAERTAALDIVCSVLVLFCRLYRQPLSPALRAILFRVLRSEDLFWLHLPSNSSLSYLLSDYTRK
jgi:hypothetical protein